MHFQGLLCTKKKEAKKMPKVSTKNKVIYTSGTVKTQIKFVLLWFWAYLSMLLRYTNIHNSESTEKAQNKSMLTKPRKYVTHGIQDFLDFKVSRLQFLGYLRTLCLKFQKAWIKIEVVVTLPCWLSQLTETDQTFWQPGWNLIFGNPGVAKYIL